MTTPLGELLVRRGLLGAAELERVLRPAAAGRAGVVEAPPASLAARLVAAGLVDDAALLACLRTEYGLPEADPAAAEIDPEVLRLVPARLARRHCLIPLSLRGACLTVAVCDPTQPAAIDEVRFASGCDVRIAVASASSIVAALDRHYGDAGACDEVLSEIAASTAGTPAVDTALAAANPGEEDAPIVRLVHALLVTAVRRGASDIHLEPGDGDLRVRLRCDGMLREILRPPAALHAAIASRIKVMARMDIAERRLPQDGRLRFDAGDGRRVELRVSSLPTLFGEKLVLRLLDRTRLKADLAGVGLAPAALAALRAALQRPHGMVLVTGPTGSGKTTTLYAALSELNTPEVNIATAEDPVEYGLDGVNQVQIHEEIGLTFAHALRGFLRQDPDVLMVGEIRDAETAEIAVKAALTGHLVLSTLHTNDAASAVDRLRHMGVAPYLVAAAVTAVVAQRLARRLCDRCRIPDPLPPEALRDLGVPADRAGRFPVFRSAGCAHCGGSGFSGRVALFEVLPVDENLRELILAGAPGAELKRAAVRSGVQTLRRAALVALEAGVTSAAEVIRVAPDD